MKLFCISDDLDTKIGMRLTGIEGIVVKSKNDVEKKLDMLLKDKEIGIVLITENLVKLCEEKIYEIKTNVKKPILVTIPSKDGESDISSNILKYISESVGIKI